MSTLVWRPNKKVITTTVSISRTRPSNDSFLLGEHYKKISLHQTGRNELRTSALTVGFIFVHIWRWWEPRYCIQTWWRHQMETFSASLALCAGNSSVTANEVSLVNTYSDTPAVLRLPHCDRHIFRNSGNWPSVSAALRVGCVVRPVRGSHQLLPRA